MFLLLVELQRVIAGHVFDELAYRWVDGMLHPSPWYPIREQMAFCAEVFVIGCALHKFFWRGREIAERMSRATICTKPPRPETLSVSLSGAVVIAPSKVHIMLLSPANISQNYPHYKTHSYTVQASTRTNSTLHTQLQPLPYHHIHSHPRTSPTTIMSSSTTTPDAFTAQGTPHTAPRPRPELKLDTTPAALDLGSADAEGLYDPSNTWGFPPTADYHARVVQQKDATIHGLMQVLWQRVRDFDAPRAQHDGAMAEQQHLTLWWHNEYLKSQLQVVALLLESKKGQAEGASMNDTPESEREVEHVSEHVEASVNDGGETHPSLVSSKVGESGIFEGEDEEEYELV